MDDSQKISGVVLAGGNSSRMGTDKALIRWKGQRLVDYLLEALQPVCDEILISTHLSQEYFEKYPVIADRHGQIGPLGGLESGLFHARHPRLIFASVDTPCLSTALFRYLLGKHESFDISLAAHGGINEPLIGIYEKKILPLVTAQILSGKHKPPALIRQSHWQEVDIHPGLNFYHPDLFKNLNRQTDL